MQDFLFILMERYLADDRKVGTFGYSVKKKTS